MITFEEFSNLIDEEQISEANPVTAHLSHYAKAVGRNLVPGYGNARRYLTQRHVDRYKMHKKIATDPNNSEAIREKSRKKMQMHKDAITKRMGE